ncbi:MAG: polysaccharide deacetylase family protein, partial [Candidatus Aenigmarchaeota archaeon]|nr:polysaccharide deacetylase family protein [Candidatus Aenigmarchaeota archaeon]
MKKDREIYDPQKHKAGVSLSFDDDHVDSWYSARPLLDKYGAKVTFCVTGFKGFSNSEWEKLEI